MAFSTPTLAALIERISDDLDARFPAGSSRLRGTFKWALARVLGATAHSVHQFAAAISKQILPTDATGEWLDLHGAIRGIARQAAVRATGQVDATGSGTVPLDAVLVRADGVEFLVTSTTSVSGTTAVPVRARVGGTGGNTASGVALALASPISGVGSSTTVKTAGITGGTERETDTAYRARILARWRDAPAGGTAADWEAWALEVEGVTRAWVDSPAAGQVRVIPATSDVEDPTPEAGVMTALEAYLETKRPLTVTLTVIEPVIVEVDFGITVHPNTTAVKTAVQAELSSLFARLGEPGGTI